MAKDPVTFTPVTSQEAKSTDLPAKEAAETASRQADALTRQIQHVSDIGIGYAGKVGSNNPGGQKQALYNTLLQDYKGEGEAKIAISVKEKPLLEMEVKPENIDKLTEALKKATTAAYKSNTDVFHNTIHKERSIHAYTPEIEENAKKEAREKFVEKLNSELGGLSSNLGTGQQPAKAKKSL